MDNASITPPAERFFDHERDALVAVIRESLDGLGPELVEWALVNLVYATARLAELAYATPPRPTASLLVEGEMVIRWPSEGADGPFRAFADAIELLQDARASVKRLCTAPNQRLAKAPSRRLAKVSGPRG